MTMTGYVSRPKLEDYKKQFEEHLVMERKNGILQVRLSTLGGPFVWSFEAHQALAEAWTALVGTFPIDRGYDVFISPVALAGWAGLLVTAFNLLPVGQLDGGHVLYSLVGQRARILTWPIVGALVLLGIFFWRGWLLWAGLIFFFGQSHPDPLDDVTRLDTSRKLLAVVVLLIFILTFTPTPMQVFTGDLSAVETGQATSCLAVVGLVACGAIGLRRWVRARQRAIQRARISERVP